MFAVINACISIVLFAESYLNLNSFLDKSTHSLTTVD